MSLFPRTDVGGVSVSRMIVGTNWFLGFSHCTPAKDEYVKEHIRDRRAIADILEVFFRAGVDTVMGNIPTSALHEGILEAQDRTGVECIIVSTPGFEVSERTPAEGLDMDEVARKLDEERDLGTRICMPHQCTTDALVDRCLRQVRHGDVLCRAIRERGMIPGFSTHFPQTIVYADESGLDVETYISIYNAMGFLMPLEVDWVARVIQHAKKPVMTIKPMAAGHLRPFQALTFVWNTIREKDMVTVGTMSPKEAGELVELSLEILANQPSSGALQETRSKASIKARVDV